MGNGGGLVRDGGTWRQNSGFEGVLSGEGGEEEEDCTGGGGIEVIAGDTGRQNPGIVGEDCGRGGGGGGCGRQEA